MGTSLRILVSTRACVRAHGCTTDRLALWCLASRCDRWPAHLRGNPPSTPPRTPTQSRTPTSPFPQPQHPPTHTRAQSPILPRAWSSHDSAPRTRPITQGRLVPWARTRAVRVLRPGRHAASHGRGRRRTSAAVVRRVGSRAVVRAQALLRARAHAPVVTICSLRAR